MNRPARKPRMKTRAEIEASLRHHVEERDKALAAREAAKFDSSEYDGAQHSVTWHSGAAAALALVLGIEGDLEEICAQVRTAKQDDAPNPNPEEHEQ